MKVTLEAPDFVRDLAAAIAKELVKLQTPEKAVDIPVENAAEKICIACGGSGKNSKGEPCICQKKKRGRPTKAADTTSTAPVAPAADAPVPNLEPTPVEPDAFAAPDPEPLKEKKPKEPPSAPPPVVNPDKDMMIVSLTAYRNKNGREQVLALLAKYGGKDSLSSVPQKNWPALYADAKAGV